VVTDDLKRTTIAVLQQTKDALHFIKRPGQSYDGAIQELIELWKKEHVSSAPKK